jgi:3D (Asp-Asp-Asp) domain-containing protein
VLCIFGIFAIGAVTAGITIGKEPTTEPTIAIVQTTTAPTTEVTTTQETTQETTQPTTEVTTKAQTTKPVTTTQTIKPKSTSTFRLTAYCNCSKCCGKWAGGATASGTLPKAGRTIAVDTKVIPFGTKVVINGHTYTAEDTGSAIKGNRIDVYFDSHSEALQFGVKYADVQIVGS